MASESPNRGRTGSKQLLRAVGVLVAVLLGIQLIAAALVMAAELIPDRYVADSLVRGINEGLITAEEHPVNGENNKLDEWTECVAFTIGLGDPDNLSDLETGITNPVLGSCGLAVPDLLAYSEGAVLTSNGTYFRYWHGYTFITRPALALAGVGGTRILSFALAIGAIIALATLVWRATSPLAAVLLVIPVLLTTDFYELASLTPHALSMATAFGSATLAWLLIRRRPSLVWMAAASIIAGSMTAFMDLLILVPGAWALVSGVALVAAYTRGWRHLRLLAAGVVVVMSWFVGLVFTWTTEWFAAGTIVGFRFVFTNIRDQMAFRVNGEIEQATDGFGSAAQLAFDYWLSRPLTVPIVLIGLGIVGFYIVRGLRSGTMDGWSAIILAAPAFIPFVWFEVLSSHTHIHYWITFQALAVAFGVFLLGLFVATDPHPSWRNPADISDTVHQAESLRPRE